MATVWEQLETDLLKIYRLPHNVIGRTSPEDAVRAKVAEVRSGLGGVCTRTVFVGPRLFLRVVGRMAYSGEWWFDADLLHRLDAAYARIFFSSADRKAAVRAILRELLAISTEWNDMTEVWAMALPAGERLTGYVGRGTPQQLFGGRSLASPGNRLLVGRAEQIFFPPMHSPFWVTKYRDLAR